MTLCVNCKFFEGVDGNYHAGFCRIKFPPFMAFDFIRRDHRVSRNSGCSLGSSKTTDKEKDQ